VLGGARRFGAHRGREAGHIVAAARLQLVEAKDDGGGGDNWTTGAISRAKLQSNHNH